MQQKINSKIFFLSDQRLTEENEPITPSWPVEKKPFDPTYFKLTKKNLLKSKTNGLNTENCLTVKEEK